ncbi:hypothetical protein Hanom_Chr14g01255271 [Helianthus anomalus]
MLTVKILDEGEMGVAMKVISTFYAAIENLPTPPPPDEHGFVWGFSDGVWATKNLRCCLMYFLRRHQDLRCRRSAATKGGCRRFLERE